MSLFRDLRIAVRHLLKSPGFSATAVLMLALGIGATTAIFSIVEGVLLRPLPFPDSSRVVALADAIQGVDVGGAGGVGVTAPDVRDYSRGTHSFSSMGAYRTFSYELSGIGDPAAVNVSRLGSGVFPALAVQPILGRVFTQQEEEQHQPLAVLSYSTWQSRFNANVNVLGAKILLDRKPYTVIGVMPRNFEFPLVPGHLNRSELWTPLSFSPQEIDSEQGNWNYQMVARLKPGVTLAQATSDAALVAAQIMRSYPATLAGVHIRPVVRPLHEQTVEQARPLVRTLFLAVSVVLLIACANLAGLLLVRAIRRRREIAVRLALGARAGTLLWQAILESLVLSVTGGLLGLVLADFALRIGLSLLPETLPRIGEIGLDWQVVAFAMTLAVLTGLLCGLAPAFASIRTGANEALKEGGRTGTSGGGHARLRSALVVAEIAIALVLLTASGLLLRSFEKMRQVDLGFQPENTLVAAYSLPSKVYSTQAEVDTFNHELTRRLQELPRVKSAGMTSLLPATGANNNGVFTAEGYTPPSPDTFNFASLSITGANYFQAMGIPLIRGRFFTPADKAGSQLVAIVNRKLAEHTWPGQDPIGKRLRVGTTTMQTPWATVVGEVADVTQGSPDLPSKQQYYVPIEQAKTAFGPLEGPTDLNGNEGFVALRTLLPPEQMENALRATVHSIDPQLPLTQVQTMQHALSDSEAPRRFNTALIASFAFAAVLLAVLGIYSVIAFSVALRSQEMAIRLALGSQRTNIVRLILISGTKLALIGCALGLAGSIAASRLLRSFLFGVSAFDPLVLSLASLLVLALAIVASLLPARRAAALDPIRALRSE